MNLAKTQCLGCLYINPLLPNMKFDAVITMWVRESEYEKGLDDELYQTVRKWIAEDWPFQKPAYPFREIDGQKFTNMYMEAKKKLENQQNKKG